jgi:flagella basal body P-ring formation protein FlgA
MKQTIAALVATIAFVAPAFADTTVQLRPRVEANGAAITLGDVFAGAGEAASRPIAPAPAPGQVTALGMDFLLAAAQSANLSFTPPAGMTEVRIVRPAGGRAMIAPQTGAEPNAIGTSSVARQNAAVRRGETVMISYQIPGLSLTTRARAVSDGAVGQTIRFVNPQSNQIIEAAITGPGAARANPTAGGNS